MNKLRIMLVDDHGIVRAGIRSLLESHSDIEVVGEAAWGEEAIGKARHLQPDLIIMEIDMAGMNGIETICWIKKELPSVWVLVLTIHNDDEFLLPVLQAGASGYVPKNANPKELLYAVRLVAKGEFFLSPSMYKWILKDAVSKNGSPRCTYKELTNREKEVLKLAAAGQTNREIAAALFLSIRTIEKYRQAIMDKLELNRREDLTKYALRKGLITLGT